MSESSLQQASRMLHDAKRYRKELDEHIKKSGPTKFLREQKRDTESTISVSQKQRDDIIAEERRKEKMGENYSADEIQLDKVLSDGSSKIWSNTSEHTKRR